MNFYCRGVFVSWSCRELTVLLCARVVTGSFDKTVRMWSSDGMLVHRLKGFVSPVSGLCYVSRCRVLWTAGGTPDAYLFEPKTGENV